MWRVVEKGGYEQSERDNIRACVEVLQWFTWAKVQCEDEGNWKKKTGAGWFKPEHGDQSLCCTGSSEVAVSEQDGNAEMTVLASPSWERASENRGK